MTQVDQLTGMIGAEVSGLDLSGALSDENAAFLRNALAAHHVLVFRDQFLDRAGQKALTRVFGAPMTLPYVEATPEDPEVIAVLKEATEVDTGVFGGDWHSDFSFLDNPPAGSVLVAAEIPPVGGDTLWSNQAAAYRTLPPVLKALVDGRRAIHVGKPYGVKFAPPDADRANASIKMTRGDPAADREIAHPAVVNHPESGEKALFLNPIYTTRFEGMSEADSAPPLAELYRHATRPDFGCRHRWRAGDVVVWDNRMTLHYATNDYDGSRRLLYRTTFAGPPPR